MSFYSTTKNVYGEEVGSCEENALIKMKMGMWGEEEAVRFLVSRGWDILGRNVRPCVKDKRCEIDIIAKDRKSDIVVFVEVKTHIRYQESKGRLAGVDARKKKNLLRACASWIMANRWHGSFRFDVVEVYGSESETPIIDHIENVPLFPPKWRFW